MRKNNQAKGLMSGRLPLTTPRRKNEPCAYCVRVMEDMANRPHKAGGQPFSWVCFLGWGKFVQDQVQ